MSSNRSSRPEQLKRLLEEALQLQYELEQRRLIDDYPKGKRRLELDIAEVKTQVEQYSQELEQLESQARPVIPAATNFTDSVPQDEDQEWPPNPFSAIRHVTGTRFTGRKSILNRLKSMLEAGSVHLRGDAKIGKSSLLRLLFQEQESKNVKAVFGDFQADDMDVIVAKVAKKIGLSVGTDWLEIQEALIDISFYLFLDELDYAPEKGFNLDWGMRLRYLQSHANDFHLITSARQSPGEILPHSKKGSEWYNLLSIETLKPFTQAEAEQLLTGKLPIQVAEQIFSPSIRQELISLTGCHPFKLMRAAFHYYDQKTNDPDHDWLAEYYEDIRHYGLE
jgi:hypothetical protein